MSTEPEEDGPCESSKPTPAPQPNRQIETFYEAPSDKQTLISPHTPQPDKPEESTLAPSGIAETSTESPRDQRLNPSHAQRRNVFAELMAPKRKQQKIEHTKPDHSKPSLPPKGFASGLLAYLTKPNSFPPGVIIRQTEHTILIRDLYPKSLVHLLLLPRDPRFYPLTPFEAFNPSDSIHTDFLELIRAEASSAAALAASELSRLISPHSISCHARNEALASIDPPTTLPAGRDFQPDIKVGVHAKPSMDTLHIHIVSVDNFSPCLKSKKHYNSFNTDFFINLDDFPLMEGDVNMTEEEQESLIKGDMKCWRCARNFGNRFKQLKDHLQEEYEEWRKI